MTTGASFEHLLRIAPLMAELVPQAHAICESDPRSSLAKARLVVELLAADEARKAGLEPQSELHKLLRSLYQSERLPLAVFRAMDDVRLDGNDAVHGEPITLSDARRALRHLAFLEGWLADRAGATGKPTVSNPFLRGPAQELAARMRAESEAKARAAEGSFLSGAAADLASGRATPTAPAAPPAAPLRSQEQPDSSGVWALFGLLAIIGVFALWGIVSAGGSGSSGAYAPGQPYQPSSNAEALVTTAGPTPMRDYNPSFDCSRAEASAEQMICASERLSEKDREMAAIYVALLRDFEAPYNTNLRRDQAAWLQKRNACSNSYDTEGCLQAAYSARLDLMQGWSRRLEARRTAASLEARAEPPPAHYAIAAPTEPAVLCVLPSGQQASMPLAQCRSMAGVVY